MAMDYRSVFVSDVHLGTRWSRAEELASFLSSIRCEKLFLVGDIIGGWKLRNNPRWPRSHNLVIRKILKMAKKTEIFYITGNHDEFVDEFEGYDFGGIRICKRAVHITADQRRFLVIHGDEFDVVVKYRKWLALLGDTAYTFSLYLNTLLTLVRSRLGLPYWSLSQYLKHRVKDAVAFVGDFEETLLAETKRGHHHGVICGHIHHPAIRNLKDAVYCNAGDWVESCSALVEHWDGSFGIVRWNGEKITEDVSERPRLLPGAPASSPETKKRSVPWLYSTGLAGNGFFSGAGKTVCFYGDVGIQPDLPLFREGRSVPGWLRPGSAARGRRRQYSI